MRRRPPRSTRVRSSAASDVYKRRLDSGARDAQPRVTPQTAGGCRMSFVRNQWYVAAYGTEVGRELFTRTVCGESIPAYRPGEQLTTNLRAVRRDVPLVPDEAHAASSCCLGCDPRLRVPRATVQTPFRLAEGRLPISRNRGPSSARDRSCRTWPTWPTWPTNVELDCPSTPCPEPGMATHGGGNACRVPRPRPVCHDAE